MRMGKGRDPMRPDTLIAVHALVAVLTQLLEGSAKDGYVMQRNYVEWDSSFLGKLLWGSLSLGNTFRSEEERYMRMKRPSMIDIMNLLRGKDLDGIRCLIGVSPMRIPWYELSPAFTLIIAEPTEQDFLYDADTADLWRRVKAAAETPIGIIETTLKEAYRLCSAMIEARSQAIGEALKDDDSDASLERKLGFILSESEPFSLSFEESNDGKIRDMLREELQAYLDDFIIGEIPWPENMMRWEKQADEILPKLQTLGDEYGIFWVTPWSFVDYQAMEADDGYRPLSGIRLAETLFALEKTGKIRIRDIEGDKSHYDIRFRIEILEKPVPVHSSLPAPAAKSGETAETSAFEFMGTLTTNDLLSSKDNPTRSLKMKQGKQKYLWQFLRTVYGTDPQPRAAAELYVSKKIGRTITLTEKDFENLIATLSSFGSRSKDDIRGAFIVGEKIGLKMQESVVVQKDAILR
ncbi:MAG: hypothetical protein PHE68_02560 [Candidatus Peribacteraceae bacterium]|nr:hypothetical protein [Candidatus Peribacteraceae bacterium]